MVGIQSSTISRASSTGHSSRVGTPRASSGSTGGARAFVPDAVGVASSSSSTSRKVETAEGGTSLLAELAQCAVDMEHSRQCERDELKKVTQHLGQIASCVNQCQQAIARREVHTERMDNLAKRQKEIIDLLLQNKE